MTRPIQALIDLAALRHNHAVAKRHAGKARMWSVIKANGYGHGALRMARGLAEVADGFALLELDTAITLRAQGIRQPLLLLEGFYNADELQAFEQHRLIPVVHGLDQANALARSGFSLPVYLKLNTGMNRLGLDAGELAAALDLLRGRNDITLMTHFSDADEPLGIDDQLQRLEQMRAMCVGLDYPLSLANSAALLRFPEALGDWVRPGIMLYGASPFPQIKSAAEIGRSRRLWRRIYRQTRDDYWRCGMWLWRRLSASRTDRHSGHGQWPTHANGRKGLDGQDLRRPHRHHRCQGGQPGYAMGRRTEC
jgi:alanine racemase